MNAFYMDDSLRLTAEDARHAYRVLRLREGDEIETLDGRGGRFLARVREISDRDCRVEIVSALPENEPPVAITVYQGIPKADKLEFLAQKLTEMGVGRLVPVRMARSVARSDGEKRVDRLRKIAREAAKQCSRALPTRIAEPMSWRDALKDMALRGKMLVPWEEARDGRILAVESDAMDFGILIGPEGGIAPEEIQDVRALGAEIVTLGPRIFRTETACVVAATLVQARWGDL